ncbi:GPP34 family phosphoprotein [Streptomyces sp. NPDC048182]|uniref:GPP34 family phosphoprotein n=1 Tax=Streptomyces sp. NPDC048182 TaxID=3365507 RepID=UPI0037217E8C
MDTARDLFVITSSTPAARSLAQGDVSLALAAAEVLDLRDAGALRLDGDRLVPAADRPWHADDLDALLARAMDQLVAEAPYETVEDWLWRRGRGLARAYADALTAPRTGAAPGRFLTRLLHGSAPSTATAEEHPVAVAHREATHRWDAGDPLLTSFAAALGVTDTPPPREAAHAPDDDLVLTVLEDALVELAAVSQRRQIEQDAYDNVWRAP